ncbi:TauD/TfdA family dioxygenase [Microbulbifer sp. MLAF003]|uniref:TauD/TfdA dioxygenase family protein n=1 Tax=unclassified Microbulbifer TaxID=2619833 RepID=UPI0024ACFEC3|nr:TauD/TfdA family dioxygenase [Microbulbifer sp. MLAF003]WHI49181.1 TauD/TfdA family dioxygenase [Microbulbifer sp. MLAF003]
MNISQYSKGCGALVEGVQLANLSDAELGDLRRAFADHGVLFFRNQSLSPDDHLTFAHRWGEIVINKFFTHTQEYPGIAEVRKEKDQETNIGGGWHTDHSYDQKPALGSILVARELPKTGGDTHFANLQKAYESLSDGLKKTLETLRAVHSNVHVYGEDGYYQSTDLASQLGGVDDVGEAIHPVVIQHPDTGRKILYVNPGFTLCFEGWTPEESRPLLNYLFAHVLTNGFTCRFNWEPGSVAFWDNRSTWHSAENDYPGQFRLMHRITLAGGALQGV